MNLLRSLSRLVNSVGGKRVLELGCGDGSAVLRPDTGMLPPSIIWRARKEGSQGEGQTP